MALCPFRAQVVLAALAAVLVVGSGSRADDARPNILFCIADDASFPHMGAYGCSWVETPAFDRVAREGLLFQRAYTPNAKCAPSRACILTGRNSWQLKEACNHWCFFPPEFKSYVEALEAHGYTVGKTGKGWAPGIAEDAAGKRRQLTGKPFDQRKQQPPAQAISNLDYAGNFEAFLEEAPDGQPWCFWYGGFEPHRAYEYGAGVNKGGKKLEAIEQVYKFWPDSEQTRTDLLDYAFEIEHFDRHLGRMLNALEKSGQLDNTLVVVTADNGMPFPRIKGQEYELSNHLPLAIRWGKGIHKPGRRIDDLVSFIDFAPTFLELAGIKAAAAGMAPITGRSLTNIFASDREGQVDAARDHVLIGKERHDIGRPNDNGYPIRGIVKDNYLLLLNYATNRWPAGDPVTGYLNCDASPTKSQILDLRRSSTNELYWRLCFGKRPDVELYKIDDDPECFNNLATTTDPAIAARQESMRKELLAALTAQQDPRIVGDGAIFDRYPYAEAKSRNFYDRYLAGEPLRAGWVSETDFEPKGLPKTIGKVFRDDPAIDELLPKDVEIEVLAGGFEWSEGPVWVPDMQRLLFCDIPRNHILQWQPPANGAAQAPATVYLEKSGYTGSEPFTGPEPGSNGLALDSEGRLILCCHGDRAIKRREKDGKLTVLASHFEGKRLNSPNDLVFHRNGDLYFTDPPYGLPKRFEDPARELDYCGVYRLRPNGELQLLTKQVTRPNGIGLSPDQKTLYVAQSDRSAYLWWKFPVRDDGSLGEGEVFFDARPWAGTRIGGCDGMAIDVHGNLWATGPGGVLIFRPDGKLLGRLGTGQRTANCCFGGPDKSVLYITADMYLCRVKTLTRGL
ncbi:MAG: SMP-30/gluconolactonase/LRE family protein [Planctomycetales bacterium]|nr:SMP-30/gluconolactonase/LRE family protein [Planctomycetales bacterium]